MVDSLITTPIGNAQTYIRTITPTRYANRRFYSIDDKVVLDEGPSFRGFFCWMEQYKPGLFNNPPFRKEYEAIMGVRVAYPIANFDSHELETIMREDLESIVSALEYTNMDSANTGLINRWWRGAAVSVDEALGIYFLEMQFRLVWT